MLSTRKKRARSGTSQGERKRKKWEKRKKESNSGLSEKKAT